MARRVVTLPGDGIGPEIMAPTLDVLGRLGDFEFEAHPFGGAAIDAHGTALTDETLAACRAADAVLLGAVGGPRWDTTDPAAPRPEQGLLGLRKGLGLFANLRPVRPLPALYDASPLRRERIEGTDLLVVRELTGGIYFGQRAREDGRAYDTCDYSVGEIERIARVGFRSARSRVTSVDKANVLETSRLWREPVGRVHGDEFPQVQLGHLPGQPAGHAAVGHAHAPARLRYAGRGRRSRIRRGPGAGIRPADRGLGRGRHHGAGHVRGPRTSLGGSSGAQRAHLDERGLRRLGGREGARPHARAALRNRGVRGDSGLRHRAGHRDLPPRRPPRPPVPVGRAVLHADPLLAGGAARRRPRADRPQLAAVLLHPADRVPWLRAGG